MRRTTALAVAALATLTLVACDDSPSDVDETPQREYGEAMDVGNGTARAYVLLDDAGSPVEIGIALSETALEGLPAPGGKPMGMDSYSYTLPLPADMPEPYGVVEVDWNPAGHPPPHVYDKPHFDFHFYAISLAERNAILPSDPDFMAKASNYPTGDFVPPGYIVVPPPPAPPEAVPMMGVHWANTAAPELQPPGSPGHHDFTHTFIYGSWDGRFTFVEPMVTREYLLTHPDDDVAISTPTEYAIPGWYPGAYEVTFDADAKEYRVAIVDLTLHD